jgi:poly [ADP-ribose] polymerase
MATIVKKIYLVKSDPVNNNNKFWKGTLFDNSDVLCEWGRVGDTGQSKMFSGAGESFLDKKVNDKKRDGRNGEIAYREIDIIDNEVTVTNSTVTQSNIKSLAMNQIKTSKPNKEVADLIEYMTKVKIQFNYDKGMFQTELGLVSQAVIDSARNTLISIGDCVANNNYGNSLMEYTRDYLMSIPQNIGRQRLELKEFWCDLSKVRQQNSVLDGLQASLVQATSTPSKTNTPVVPEEQVFNVQLDVVNDSKIVKEIFDYYYDTRSKMHNSYSYKPKKMWQVTIGDMNDAFEKDGKKMNNIVPAFHGTSSENLLSLLKSGFLVRPPNSAHISGKLFGNGIYGAPLRRVDGKIIKGASTKALNYATNFWGGKTSQRTFMFFIKMAMGNFYTPTAKNYQSISYPVKGYDSTWAFGDYSGVRNDESIVYRSSQCNINYLVEFE